MTPRGGQTTPPTRPGSRSRSTSLSEPTTTSAPACGGAALDAWRDCTTRIPAAAADCTPAGESSIARHAAGRDAEQARGVQVDVGFGLRASDVVAGDDHVERAVEARGAQRGVHPAPRSTARRAQRAALARARSHDELACAVEGRDRAGLDLGGDRLGVAFDELLNRRVEAEAFARPRHVRLNGEPDEGLVLLHRQFVRREEAVRGAPVHGLGVHEHAVEVEDEGLDGSAHAESPSLGGALPSTTYLSRHSASRSAWRR